MGRTNTQKMVQGAMIAAMFGALSLFNTYTGSMFDIFICYAMVIPLVWYGYTYSLIDNVIVCIVSMIVIAMMGLPFFIVSSLSSCLAGLFIGEALKRKTQKGVILLGTLVVTFLNNIFIYEVFSGLLGVDLNLEMTKMYQMFISTFPNLSQQVSLDSFLAFIPLVMLVLSVMEMYVIVMLCQLVLTRLKIEFPGSFHIAMMHLSRNTGIILVVMLFSSYCIQRFMSINHILLSYMSIIGEMALAIQGLAFLCWLCILNKRSKLMILVFIGIFIPVVNMIYAGLGIVDIFSDLRGDLLYNRNSSE